MNNKLLDYVMSQMCDVYCRFPSDDTLTQDQLDEVCSHCTLRLFLEIMDR